jgi:hypothetical protein
MIPPGALGPLSYQATQTYDIDVESIAGSMEAEPNRWSGELPSDGDYTIRVYLMRNEARRDGNAHYSVDISISDPEP